ncbi:MAG: methyltransferase domain-containing protein [Alphaproteobacteria bacterium]|nr:methyltransferase domain-containing protein [Alphaproteobacteria bacterium]
MSTVTKQASPLGTIAILENRKTGVLIYQQGHCHQSEADANGVSISAYIHALFGLLQQAGSRDVLLIGCGGGTLATMLHRAGATVTMVDIDETAFDIARRYFKLPKAVECYIADGETFLAQRRHRYDAIVLDAYIGTEIPAQFLEPRFFKLARTRLKKPRGCLFANAYIVNSRDRKADRLATAMGRVFSGVRLLDEKGSTNRNAIAMAGAVAELVPPSLIMKPKADVDDIANTLKRMRFRSWRPRAS